MDAVGTVGSAAARIGSKFHEPDQLVVAAELRLFAEFMRRVSARVQGYHDSDGGQGVRTTCCKQCDHGERRRSQDRAHSDCLLPPEGSDIQSWAGGGRLCE